MKKQNSNWVAHHRLNKIETKGPLEVRVAENEKKKKSREKSIIEHGLEHVRAQENKKKAESRDKLIIEHGLEHVRAQENKKKTESRTKLIVEKGPIQVRKEEKESTMKNREKSIIEHGLEHVRAGENKKKAKSRTKLIVEKGPIQVRKGEKESTMKNREKSIIECGLENVRKEEKKRTLKSRKRRMIHEPQIVLDAEKKRKRLSRLVNSSKERLKKFRKQTMFNAIFSCSCCQRNLFDCNVSNMDSKLIADVETKRAGLFKRAVEYQIEIEINGKRSAYICHACKKHLKAGKLPPMSANNGLKIPSTDTELELTELEGNLIAKRIIFMKIYQLPKTR